MASSSRSQQRLFGMVYACKKTGKCASLKIKKIADDISQKDAKDFAKTKHKGLPEKVKKKKKKKRKIFKDWIEEKHPEFKFDEILGTLGNIALAAAAVTKTAIDGKEGRGFYSRHGDNNYSSGNRSYIYINNFLQQNWNWQKIINNKIIGFYYFYENGYEDLDDQDFVVINILDYPKFKNQAANTNKKTGNKVNINQGILHLKSKEGRNYWDDRAINQFYKAIDMKKLKPEDFNGIDIRNK